MKSLLTTSVLRVAENALEVRFSLAFLHRAQISGVAGVLDGLDVRSTTGTVSVGTRIGHAGPCLPLTSGQTRGDSPGGRSARGDDMSAALRPPFQSFLLGPVNGLLGAV